MIYIEDSFRNDETMAFWLSEGEDDSVLHGINGATKLGDRYITKSNLWDIVGDLAFAIYTEGYVKSNYISADKRITIRAGDALSGRSKYYTPETLIKVFSKLKGWSIILNSPNNKEEKKMMNEGKFFVECPPFEGKAQTLVAKGRPKRDYAHPLDSGIIKFLDNSMVNSIFSQVIALAYDKTYGQWIASGVMVNENTYPEINEIVNECVDELGIARPYVVISNTIVGLNAATFGNDEEAYIMLGPFLTKSLNREQLKFEKFVNNALPEAQKAA